MHTHIQSVLLSILWSIHSEVTIPCTWPNYGHEYLLEYTLQALQRVLKVSQGYTRLWIASFIWVYAWSTWQSSRSIYSEYIEIGFLEFIKVVEIGIHKTDFMNLIFRVRAELLSIYSYTHNLLDWRVLWIRVEVYTWKSWAYTRQIGLAFFMKPP